jgi:flagellar biosynthesis/type III secretory pathway M-ring protein FliF/YscJ
MNQFKETVNNINLNNLVVVVVVIIAVVVVVYLMMVIRFFQRPKFLY